MKKAFKDDPEYEDKILAKIHRNESLMEVVAELANVFVLERKPIVTAKEFAKTTSVFLTDKVSKVDVVDLLKNQHGYKRKKLKM